MKLETLVLGSSEYLPEPAAPLARVDLSRTVNGWAMRLRFRADLTGPCIRCLADAEVVLDLDLREVDQLSDQAAGSDLECPYLEKGLLDVSHWATDAVTLAFPPQPLCDPDCAGICPACGERLEPGQEPHPHSRSKDPRMSALDDLRFD